MGKVLDEKYLESSASYEESEERRREWLVKFSTMKVGPPKGVRHATGQANAVEDGSTSLRRPVRMAGEEAKKRLEWYHEF